MPGKVAVLLVVNENGVPAPVPVELFGKKLNWIAPPFGVAPPPPVVNGSAVVFATAIPVSYGGETSANGMSNVVLAGTILTIVVGPTSASLNCGYPPPLPWPFSVGNPSPALAVDVSCPVPIGNSVAVTETVAAVVIDAFVAIGVTTV